MKAQDLLAQIGSGSLPGVSVFYGAERWFGGEAVRLARLRFLGDDAEGYLSFDAPRGPNDSEGTPLGGALDEARTFPMFGGRKLIVYRARTLADEEVEMLAGLAGSTPDFARVVVLVESLPRGGAKKLAAAGAATGEARKLFDTPWGERPDWDTALNKWAAARALEAGKRMTLMTAHALTSVIGNDLGAIDSALAKLSVAAADRPEIGEDDVRALTGGGREFGAFAFGEAIYARDTAKALKISRNAFREGMEDQRGRRSRNPGFVVGRLLWSVGFRLKDIYRASRVLAAGGTDAEAEKAMGRKSSGITKKIVRQAAGFRPEVLEQHWVLLADAEAEVRTPVPVEAIIEGLIPRLTGGARG